MDQVIAVRKKGNKLRPIFAITGVEYLVQNSKPSAVGSCIIQDTARKTTLPKVKT